MWLFFLIFPFYHAWLQEVSLLLVLLLEMTITPWSLSSRQYCVIPHTEPRMATALYLVSTLCFGIILVWNNQIFFLTPIFSLFFSLFMYNLSLLYFWSGAWGRRISVEIHMSSWLEFFYPLLFTAYYLVSVPIWGHYYSTSIICLVIKYTEHKQHAIWKTTEKLRLFSPEKIGLEGRVLKNSDQIFERVSSAKRFV